MASVFNQKQMKNRLGLALQITSQPVIIDDKKYNRDVDALRKVLGIPAHIARSVGLLPKLPDPIKVREQQTIQAYKFKLRKQILRNRNGKFNGIDVDSLLDSLGKTA